MRRFRKNLSVTKMKCPHLQLAVALDGPFVTAIVYLDLILMSAKGLFFSSHQVEFTPGGRFVAVITHVAA